MVNPNFPVPDRIPGQLITNRTNLRHLRDHMSNLCGLNGLKRFPGSQPVSFTKTSLKLLETEDFWVCEKSDGVRVMVMVVVLPTPHGPVQEVYFFNRKDEFYRINNVIFPHHENFNRFLKDTIIDGELVIDVDPKTLQHQLRFLAFDCIVWEGENLMKKPLINRYGRLKEWVIKPMNKLLEIQPRLIERMPFDVRLKSMELAYGIDKVLNQDLPKLTHGNDGLIFTSATSPYSIGTDPKILKWKPPSENSIDFRLELRFPPLLNDQNEPDFYQKPLFVLMMNCGRDGDQYFDMLEMSDEEWLERKRRREQLDNRVVEVVWDFDRLTWKIMRFRDDKRDGNYKDVVFSIIESIKAGVEADELIKSSQKIRQAWKTRAESNLKNLDNSSTKQQSNERMNSQNVRRAPTKYFSPNQSRSTNSTKTKQNCNNQEFNNGDKRLSSEKVVKIKIVGGDPRRTKRRLREKYISMNDISELVSSLKRL
ncbi:mRNA guanylyltransferase [Phakopsora pachyrhizi]|uniref:mRNA-capping enzyme subunit alpha n=1 Tax=Phakopsora pachyrhizi TaxID=170000 RepID=A0AAV0B0S3_PHAPC|nr:mRNA guanylyltransferase [Phakopsora pachyrhizi]CAH7676405.1 mRNA guanylyltransferase [Phakopsora pachyrhizi]